VWRELFAWGALRVEVYVPSAVTKQPQINIAVSSVVSELAPDVRRVRFEIGDDWSGQPAIFFRVLLSDDASRWRLRDMTTCVVWQMSEKLNLPDLGLFPYFDFRSESEQAALKEPEWAAAS
jgi:hypothetical protein